MKTKILLLCFSVFAVVVGVGCEVTSEKIQTWKQSMKGAAKIRAAIRDNGQKLAIRVEAATAMGELGLFLPLVEDLKATIDHLKTSAPDVFLTTVAYPIRGTDYHREVEARITVGGSWSERTDRDLRIAGRHSRRYYRHATR